MSSLSNLTISDLKKASELEALQSIPGIKENAFYADKETLQQASEGYSFVNSITVINKWIENCGNCRRAMKFILIGPQAKLSGIPESALGVVDDPDKPNVVYHEWVTNPVIDQGNEFWFCSGCSSVWTIIRGNFWAKVEVEGESTLDELKIKPVESEVIKVAEEPEIDPGEQPDDPTATKCPNCKVWRTVEPYQVDKIQHVCPKCGAVDLFKIPPQEVAAPSQEEI